MKGRILLHDASKRRCFGQGGATWSVSFDERRSQRILLYAWDFCSNERVRYRSRRISARKLLHIVAEVGYSGERRALPQKLREQKTGRCHEWLPQQPVEKSLTSPFPPPANPP